MLQSLLPQQSQRPDLPLSFQSEQRESFLQSPAQQPGLRERPEQPRAGSQSPFLPELVLNTQTRTQLDTAAATSHPSQILNSLPLRSQEKFLEQFLSLTPEHQNFVYRKLLSSPPDIQQFAIEQFVSLDNRVLIVSIQVGNCREK